MFVTHIYACNFQFHSRSQFSSSFQLCVSIDGQQCNFRNISRPFVICCWKAFKSSFFLYGEKNVDFRMLCTLMPVHLKLVISKKTHLYCCLEQIFRQQFCIVMFMVVFNYYLRTKLSEKKQDKQQETLSSSEKTNTIAQTLILCVRKMKALCTTKKENVNRVVNVKMRWGDERSFHFSFFVSMRE